MTNQKRIGKVLYLITGISYFLTLVLPVVRFFSQPRWTLRFSFQISNFSLGRLLSSFETITGLWTFLYLILSIIHLPLILVSIILLYSNYRNEEKYIQRIENIENAREEYDEMIDRVAEKPHWFKQFLNRLKFKIQKVFAKPVNLAFLFGFLALWGVMAYRDRIILLAFNQYLNLQYGVAYYHIGFYFLLLAVILNYGLTKIRTTYSEEQLRDKLSRHKSSIKNAIISPLGVQIFTIYAIALLLMFISYGIHAGWSRVLNAPNYYMELMITYGLNHQGEVHVLLRIFSWILAPFFVLFLGVPLFFLESGGFAPNGPGITQTVPESKYLDPGRQYDVWAYFSRDVPLSGDYLEFFGYKGNFFYLGLVFGSIFAGIIISSIINYYKFEDRTINYKHFLIFICSFAFFIGVEMALITGPVLITPANIVYSVFVNRFENFFIIYKLRLLGGYHPLTLFWIITLSWILVMTFSLLIGLLMKSILSGSLFEKKEHEQFVGRAKSSSKEKIPFTK